MVEGVGEGVNRRDPSGYHRRVALADASEAVLAGSPAFLNAVLPPLSAALGFRPRVADAPHQVLALCQDGARLLVFEFRGMEWLPLAEDLKSTYGDELSVLVAVPGEHAAASGPLLGAGADEVLPWDGAAEPVVAAAGRLAGPPAASFSPPSWFQAQADDGEPQFSIVEAPPDARERWGDAELVAFEPSDTWPGTVLPSRDAEGLLAGALAGFWPDAADLKAHTEKAVADLSAVERDAIAGRPVPADPAPICRAAALRWQVSAALATAPAPGNPVDAAAVRGILAEIDAVLAELKRLSSGAPSAALPQLDQLRRGLVARAVDLTEAVHRISPPPSDRERKAAPAPA